jgi:hypothetical protein
VENVRHLNPRDPDGGGTGGGFERIPPQDLDAEQAYLGGLLFTPPAHQRTVHALVASGDFYRPAHTTIHQAAGALIDRGDPVDPIILGRELTKRGDLARIGGSPYLTTLANSALTASAAEHYADIIRDLAARRRIIEHAASIVQHGYDDTVTGDDLRAYARESITAATDDPAAPGTDTTGWDFSDLTPVLDGTHKPAQPDIGARDDGIGMFYPGHVNGITGESEAGKSWVALISCLVEINRGNRVVYLDFEDSEAGIVSRLLLIGATPDQIASSFLYVRPGATPTPSALRAFIARIRAVQPTLVIVDGVTEAMVMLGLELKENTEIAKFGRMLLRPLADTGAAVVPLDHVVKAGENRGRYALGGVHKLNAVDGVQYMLEAVRPFGINAEGRSRLRIAKDRPAQVRRHALPGGRSSPMHWFADLVIKSEGEEFAEAHLYPPIERHADSEPAVTAEEKKAEQEEQAIAEREEAVLKALARALEPLTTNNLAELIPGRASVTRRAVTRLVHAGRVVAEKGARGAALHHLPAPDGGAK